MQVALRHQKKFTAAELLRSAPGAKIVATTHDGL